MRSSALNFQQHSSDITSLTVTWSLINSPFHHCCKYHVNDASFFPPCRIRLSAGETSRGRRWPSSKLRCWVVVARVRLKKKKSWGPSCWAFSCTGNHGAHLFRAVGNGVPANYGFNLGALQQRKRKEKAELAEKEHYELKTVEVEWIEISRHEFCEKAGIGTFSLSVTIEGSSAEIQRSRRPMTLTDQGPSSDPSPEALEQLRECECAQFQRHFQSHFFRDLKVKKIQRKILQRSQTKKETMLKAGASKEWT